MGKPNDGGQAFPCHVHPDSRDGHDMGGMSLRDYFAAQAMYWCDGKAANYELTAWFGSRTGITPSEIRAAQAYAIADAMLAQRAEQPK